MHQYFIYCRKSIEDDDHHAISLESQRIELPRFAEAHGLAVRDVLTESKSARLPGRRFFNQMMARIRKGEAMGIIAWHPDRLARNSVNGGQIIHFLNMGRLADLQFPTYVFDEGPQGKFMLAIVLGYSKYQVDTLWESVRRGNRTKRDGSVIREATDRVHEGPRRNRSRLGRAPILCFEGLEHVITHSRRNAGSTLRHRMVAE